MSFGAHTMLSLLPYITSIFIIALIIWIFKLETRVKRLLRGKHAKSLEETILLNQTELHQLIDAQKNTNKTLENINTRLSKSIQGVGVVRFNPFQGTSGSNQSFSAAFLDEEGNGVIITSLYSREHVSTFAKPIKHKASEYGLTPEEKSAIEKATTAQTSKISNSPNKIKK